MKHDPQPFLQAEFVGPESGQYQFDLSDLHWSMFGQQLNFKLNESDVDPGRSAPFEVLIQLSTTPFSLAPETLDISIESVGHSGDSCFDPAADTMIFEFAYRGQAIKFSPISNDKNRLAGFNARMVGTLDEVMAAVRSAVNVMLVSLVAPTRTPCFVDEIFIRSTDNKQRYYRTIAHFPVTAPLNRPSTIPALVPTIVLYAEGIRATSVFYRFLCFFKIVDQIIERVAPALTRSGATVGEPPLKFNVTLPSRAFQFIAPELTGKKVTAIRSDFQKEYRNVIAHFDLNSPIQPFSLQAEAAVGIASAVMFFAADELLSATHSYINAIKRKGVDVEGLTF